MFIELTNTPRDYAWGSLDGISSFVGRPAGGGPEAELWFGTHPGSPSRTPRTFPPSTPGHATLRDWVAAEPEGLLGSPDATELPILLKVLAARTPLSLQVHPSPQQAEQGYADEVARGVGEDAFGRSYKDPYPKPEIIVAVSDQFEALGGFRPADQVATFARDLADLSSGSSEAAVAPLLRLLATPTEVEAVVDWLLSGDEGVAACVSTVTVLAGGEAAARSRSGATFATVTQLAEHYPGDPGVVIAALMNRVTLRPGESLYMPAGMLHAYLKGVGVELMIASDNVLRGGLTPKHVDTGELLRILSFDQAEPELLAPRRPSNNLAVYAPPAGFALTVVDVTADPLALGAGPSIVLVERGVVTLAGADATAVLTHGDAVFIPAAERQVSVSGTGRVWVAAPAPDGGME